MYMHACSIQLRSAEPQFFPHELSKIFEIHESNTPPPWKFTAIQYSLSQNSITKKKKCDPDLFLKPVLIAFMLTKLDLHTHTYIRKTNKHWGIKVTWPIWWLDVHKAEGHWTQIHTGVSQSHDLRHTTLRVMWLKKHTHTWHTRTSNLLEQESQLHIGICYDPCRNKPPRRSTRKDLWYTFNGFQCRLRRQWILVAKNYTT